MKHLCPAILAVTALLIVAMAAGTFIEREDGHEAAAASIYHAPWFIALWALLGLGGGVAIVRWKMWRRLWVFLLHASLLLILIGAFLSHNTARQGTLHLRQGQTANYYFPADADHSVALPFTLRLDSFIVAYTSGTGAPRDFESRVTVLTEGEKNTAAEPYSIRMNRPLSCRGYRFYQTSFDTDQRGTILTVSYDPYGLPLTYAAYALLGLSMIILLARRLPFGKFYRHSS